MTCSNLSTLWWIFSHQLLRCLELAEFFVVFSVTYFDFFSDIKLKGFNIGHKKIRFDLLCQPIAPVSTLGKKCDPTAKTNKYRRN